MNKTVEIDREDILGLVNCAEDYGFNNSTLLSAFADWLKSVSDEEIQEYANGYLTEGRRAQGYGEEDRDAAIERLTEWRNRYLAKK